MRRISSLALVAALVWPGSQGSLHAQETTGDHESVMGVVNQLADTRRTEGCER